MAERVLDIAGQIAEEALFPAALATDRAEVVPVALLDALADAGLYGLAGPSSAGGLEVGPPVFGEVVEVLASGCLTTTFVWLQHQGPVAAVANSGQEELRREWLEPLCRGEQRAGIAFAGLRRPGPPVLTATPVDGGWVLDGFAPWVTGWGRIDAILTGARHGDGIVWSLVDTTASPTLQVEPLELAAVAASATVTLRFRGHAVPASRVLTLEPYEEWRAADATRLRTNGYLSLGVTRRCCALLGPTPLDSELRDARAQLDGATVEGLPAARAHASALAMRSATALVIASGGRSVLLDHHAQRLAREAMFLQVFGQTASIRKAQAAISGLG